MKTIKQALGMLAVCLLGALTAWPVEAQPPAAKNTILFIGDGMGPAHVTATRLFIGGSDGQLSMESMPFTGYCRTNSSNGYVTDSAAASTALSCGVKTQNGFVCMSDPMIDPTGTSRPLQTLTDIMLASGKSVGIVTTKEITDATPAAFYAHNGDRWDQTTVANQIATSGLTLLLGGGRVMFHDANWEDPETGSMGYRTDGRDLESEMISAGWTFVHSRQELNQIDPADPSLRLIGTFQPYAMNYDYYRPNDVLGEPSLTEMTAFAIDVLSYDPDGYFLMVEGGLIDSASHSNYARMAVMEVLGLDKAVRMAMDTVDSQTLVVVTADHETGGLALNGYAGRSDIIGERLFGNVYDEGSQRGLISWGTGLAGNSPAMVDESNLNYRHRAAYYRSYSTHTAVDVPLMATGPGAMDFCGFHDNTDIPRIIARLMGVAYDSKVNQDNYDAYIAQKNATQTLPYE